jgi:hypothetical protein
MDAFNMKTNKLILIGILIIAFAATIAPVMAADTGTAIITGNPPAKMDITMHGGITDWDLDPDPAAQPLTDSTNVTMDVRTNTKSWDIRTRDALDGGKTSAGFMEEWTGAAYGTQTLTNALVVAASDESYYTADPDITLTGVNQRIGVSDGAAHAAGNHLGLPLTFKQTVDIADPVLAGTDVYRIIVTFTGTTL